MVLVNIKATQNEPFYTELLIICRVNIQHCVHVLWWSDNYTYDDTLAQVEVMPGEDDEDEEDEMDGSMVSMEGADGQQYVVLEVIQLQVNCLPAILWYSQFWSAYYNMPSIKKIVSLIKLTSNHGYSDCLQIESLPGWF